MLTSGGRVRCSALDFVRATWPGADAECLAVIRAVEGGGAALNLDAAGIQKHCPRLRALCSFAPLAQHKHTRWAAY